MAHRVADPTGADVEVPEESHQRVLRITLLGYIAAVLLITQWPDPPDPGSLGWLQRALAWLHDNGLPGVVDLLVVEALANVVMFVPLGLLLPVATRTRAWLAVPAGAGFAALIELSQLTFLPHRIASRTAAPRAAPRVFITTSWTLATRCGRKVSWESSIRAANPAPAGTASQARVRVATGSSRPSGTNITTLARASTTRRSTTPGRPLSCSQARARCNQPRDPGSGGSGHWVISRTAAM